MGSFTIYRHKKYFNLVEFVIVHRGNKTMITKRGSMWTYKGV